MTSTPHSLPIVPMVTVKPRQLNERLWELHRLCATGTATRVQLDELDAMCRNLESEQDNDQ